MKIYLTINKVNGKIYIGQDSRNIINYLGSGIHIVRAIKKYGKNNFVKIILREANNIDELNELEIHYIKLFNSRDPKIGYNIAEGGKGILGIVHTEESRKKMSEALKGRNTWNKGIPQSEQVKLKLSNSCKGKPAWNKGKHLSAEQKEKISIANKGKKLTEEHKLKISNGCKGKSKIFTEEHKLNIGKAGKGRKLSEEHKMKIRDSHKKKR